MSKQTQMIKITESNKDEVLSLAAEIIKRGGLVVFPTETVYGIGANALDFKAVAGIFKAKGRPQDNPLIVHVSDMVDAYPLVREFPQKAEQLAKKFWPGPLTIILPRTEIINELVSAGLDTVAIRIPGHATARELIKKAGVPIAAPSANRSGSPSPTSADHCYSDLAGRVDLIIDDGHCEVGIESTVISLAGEIPLLLRPGGITPRQLEEVIGPIDISPAVTQMLEKDQLPQSPGMKYRHYAPKAKVILVHGSPSQFANYCNKSKTENSWAMVFDEDLSLLTIPAVSYGSVGSDSQQATKLFSVLREVDGKSPNVIFVHSPKAKGLGLAVYNRLLRAAAFNEIYL